MSETRHEGARRLHPVADYARGSLVIGFFCAAGFAVCNVSVISIPAPLVGMVLLAGAFKLGLPVGWVETAGSFLLKHMSLFFLPILLGAGRELVQNKGARVPVFIAVVGGTVLTLVVTQWVCERRMAGPAREEGGVSVPSATEWMWIGLTLGSYAVARWLHAKSPAGLRRAVPPLLMGLAVLSGVVFLAAGGDSGPARAGGSWLVWCLVPATVALALPLTQSAALWRQAPRVLTGVVAGVAVNIAWTTVVCRWWGVAPVIEASLRPKTATAAIALVCAQGSGGLASMGAAFAVLCGLLGSWLYPLVFRKGCSALALGVAVGTVAHGIGTSRLANETHPPDADGISAPGASAFAMALAGCCTALLVWPWMG